MTLDIERLRKIQHMQGEAFYLLDTKQFTRNFKELLTAFRHYYPNTEIAYSYKTNYTPRLCKLVEELGGYAEVVSSMEYEIARRLNVPINKIHLNGPYKEADIMREIILGGGTVNLDDYNELAIVEELAERHPKQEIKIGLRCNFDIGDGVISRFGFDTEKPAFRNMLKQLEQKKNIRITGIQCHFASRALDNWPNRAENICRIASEECSILPKHIDLGGGLFGKMKDSLKAQFPTAIPTYEEYAKVAATIVARHFERREQPTLFIEPGSALVGDVMKFAAPVISIKDIRGKAIATLLGSVYNINPTLNGKNPPLSIFSDAPEQQVFTDLDMAGYTCIEGDYLFRHYTGKLAKGDIVVFENVGSYSIVLKPPFILPNFPILEIEEDGEIHVTKRRETFDDIFHTFEFDNLL